MSFTFQGKNIQDFYKSGPISVIPKFLTTEKVPENEFERNFPTGIKINGQDINEQAISTYTDCNATTTVSCTGYKHFSAYGQGGTGGSGGKGGDNSCRSAGNGGSGAVGAKFGILKYPLNNATTITINIGGNGGPGSNTTNNGSACKTYGNNGGTGGTGGASSILINGTTIVSGNGGTGGNGGGRANANSNGGGGTSGSMGNTDLISGARDGKLNIPALGNASNTSKVRIYLHCQI
jgi:hypothetical protein